MTTEERQAFGGYLRELRTKARKSLRCVQREAGISPGYLSLIETGVREPPQPRFLWRLATSYAVRRSELMCRAGYVEEGMEDWSVEEYPEDVRQAIEWHHQAKIAHREAKRDFEIHEAQALLGVSGPDQDGTIWSPARQKDELLRMIQHTRAELDRLDLEEERRHRWLVFVTGRELRREERR